MVKKRREERGEGWGGALVVVAWMGTSVGMTRMHQIEQIHGANTIEHVCGS